MHRLGRSAGIAFSAVLICLGAGSAAAQTGPCVGIYSLPFRITRPGSYCLTRNLSTPITTGAAITIAASNVLLDLKGCKLEGTAAMGVTTAAGIKAEDRSSVTIRNGTIRGFETGVHLYLAAYPSPSSANVVEDLRIERSRTWGIVANGTGTIIRRNLVYDLGDPTDINAIDTTGISTGGDSARILDNDISRVNNLGGQSTGIQFEFGTHQLAAGNRISDAAFGVRFVAGTAATGKYRGNITLNVPQPYSGGIDLGTND